MTTAAERKYIRELKFFTTAILIIREMEENNPAHACNKKIQTKMYKYIQVYVIKSVHILDDFTVFCSGYLSDGWSLTCV